MKRLTVVHALFVFLSRDASYFNTQLMFIAVVERLRSHFHSPLMLALICVRIVFIWLPRIFQMATFEDVSFP
jgi:hypothetical protein